MTYSSNPFYGASANTHQKARELRKRLKPAERKLYDFLDESSAIELYILRKDFSVFNIIDQSSQRPLKVSEKKLELFIFTGSRIIRTIQFLFDMAGITTILDEQKSVLEIKASDEEFQSRWGSWDISQVELDLKIQQKIESNPSVLGFSKWAVYLPILYQTRILKLKYFDFDSAFTLLGEMKLVRNS